ncbi:probable dolichyl pyrophosphate Man9GlcNAc2 alpha-1,3-glucosyltransferase [Prosopis cineraria]|uniref:probable dolichyl pyrophosphate Man9GlcNAc2 alpha-1,3-glucosyltransferase n=1 Tax=Prosopis cineraria TaxID=364024 RepID=UPI00240F233F|nr:probable dolichyl pyrophosphate Man9GlcNAc2 alpha-1,3-glucosyltransferase [Prosopis cineraria]XP_054787552.1 probable dolichyl pyrophosphate Man9GlcNAc2 alpha-1,3-glucosyltransferase [Prosopis cineraria]XP_054787553.1 probable dolichyl pyrophosphate Man9GlcNAc2 alpha-1,3-glucosyltransferase [Prosopis cineraria]XP_054787554.1 probable dolichyl pyrophosphate Man9GlcNAc2 alpha-1,3-glucosyltransferase [Prosopis cineraria]XP_054787555.1 probable dolichyl pyrophosphate Man9GlcNAc2 alpha-1,3-glucos
MTKGKRKTVNVDDGVDDCWRWLIQREPAAIFATVAVFALLVRAAVSLHPYSGAGHPPKYGDYEAQRHWMEITLNLPVREWYRNSTTNDLSYWGLDYPPLTAYQSFIHGLFLRFFHPDSVSLFSSRGHESYLGKLLMRWTVLSSDALIFFPSIIYFIIVYYNQPSRCHKRDIWWHTALLLLNPCLILIDHGHFQFNCISLGLSTGAVAAILSGQYLFACVLYCLAINHKQMSIYFAPAFFSHLLGKCLRRKYPLLEVAKLGLVVLGTFAAVWWPYLYSMESILEVLSRLAPFERGIYEDYVANFWCTSSILIKWKKLFTTQSLKLLSFTATVLACLPSMTQQIKSPSNQGFLYGLLTSSISFYLFSFQVHEKSILLPLLPASLLAVEEPFLFRWFMQFAMFSMFPLICRDGLVLAYLASFALFILIFFAPGQNRNEESSYYFSTRIMRLILNVLCFILHVVYLVMRPPEKYPFLFEALTMNLCFSQFVLVALCTNLKQWMWDNHVKLE